MSLFSLLLPLLLQTHTDSVPGYYPYSIKSSDHPFVWEQVEWKQPKKFRDSVIKEFRKTFHDILQEGYMNSKEFDSAFHFANLNGDAFPDLVYVGGTGGEGTMVKLYLNEKKAFRSVFTDYMEIIDMRFENNRLSYLVIYNYGCCAETVQFERHFAVDSLFHIRLVLQRAILQGMSVGNDNYAKPEGFFDHPIKFKVLNANYALRYAPAIVDTLPLEVDFDGRDNGKGNIIALYPASSRGVAWAYKKDNTGREWWLVEMEPAVFLPFKRFWDYDDKLTHYYGWMSSRFVEKLP